MGVAGDGRGESREDLCFGFDKPIGKEDVMVAGVKIGWLLPNLLATFKPFHGVLVPPKENYFFVELDDLLG